MPGPPPPGAAEPAPRVPGPGRVERLLRLLLLAAVALRLGYVAQATALPFLDAPLYDSEVYLRQARQIAAGHFGDASLVAFSPLYGWLLALLGRRVSLVVAAQLALGVFTLWLLCRVARQRAGERAALLAGALWLGYGLPMFYETKVLSETLGLALAIGGLALFVGALRAGRVGGRLAAAGVVLGLSALARASLLFTLPLYVLAALLAAAPVAPAALPAPAAARGLGLRLGRAAGVALGIGAVLVGNGLWNRAHSGLFVPVILVSRTAAVATRHDWAGDFRVFADPVSGSADVSPWDVVRQAQERIDAHRRGEAAPAAGAGPFGVDLGGWMRRLPSTLRGTTADRETSFDYGYYGERSEVPVLAALPVSFALLELLAVAGAVLLVLRRRAAGALSLVPLLPLLLGTLATTTLFYPTSRYRLPMALSLVLIAAECAPGLAALRLRPRRLVAAALALLALGFSVRTLSRRLEQPADWHLRVAEAAARAGDVDEARRRLDLARRLAPGDPAVLHRIDTITGPRRKL